MKGGATFRTYKAASAIRQSRRRCVFTNKQRQLVLGTLLGDGCLVNVKGAVTRRFTLVISHCKKQFEYIKHKRDALCVENNLRIEKSGYGSVRYRLNYSNPALAEVAKIVLTDGKKTVTKEWLSQLTWEGIAYWFMDDGCLTTTKSGASNITLCTNNCSQHELDLICEHFSSLGFTFRVNDEIKTRYMRITKNKEALRFLACVKKYVLPCFQYKVRSLLGVEYARMTSTEFCAKMMGFELRKQHKPKNGL